MNVNKDRRKRVNTIKKAIILLIIILITVPTIICIILGLKVNQLQRQVDELTAARGVKEYSEKNSFISYAYAAIKTSGLGTLNQDYAILTPPLTQNLQKSSDTDIQIKVNDDKKISDNNKEKNLKEEKKTTKKKTTDKKKGVYSGKKVYLTFDDGPSKYTDKILDILDDYNIKATFFVIGKTDKRSKEQYKRIVKDGHTLGMHSYTHDYNKIYNSLEDFDKDFTKLRKLLYDTTGYRPSIYRFPGGSKNTISNKRMKQYIRYLNKKDIVYFDWNVANGDATRITYTKKQLVKNVLNGVAKKDKSIVLMHDTKAKKATVESLPVLIKALIKGDAQILPLDNNVKAIQMIKSDTIK